MGKTPNSNKYKKSNFTKLAFTMAEVLITLGIIGVVAAMTLPSLIKNYEQKVTATKVYKFYSMINQALLTATINHGEPAYWIYGNSPISFGDASYINYENNLKFVETYFMPYIKIINCENYHLGSSSQDSAAVKCLLPDRASFILAVYGFDDVKKAVDITYISNFARMNKSHMQDKGNLILTNPRYAYYFSLLQNINDGTEEGNIKNTGKTHGHYVGIYTLNWDGTEEGLTKPGTKYSCSKDGYSLYPAYCTKLLELHGWKYPDKYPW